MMNSKSSDAIDHKWVVSVIVHFEAHPIFDFVVFQSDVVLIDDIPFLQSDLLRPSANPCRNQLLELQNCVRGTAFYALPLSHPVIYHNFYQNWSIRVVGEFSLPHQIEYLSLFGDGKISWTCFLVRLLVHFGYPHDEQVRLTRLKVIYLHLLQLTNSFLGYISSYWGSDLYGLSYRVSYLKREAFFSLLLDRSRSFL